MFTRVARNMETKIFPPIQLNHITLIFSFRPDVHVEVVRRNEQICAIVAQFNNSKQITMEASPMIVTRHKSQYFIKSAGTIINREHYL